MAYYLLVEKSVLQYVKLSIYFVNYRPDRPIPESVVLKPIENGTMEADRLHVLVNGNLGAPFFKAVLYTPFKLTVFDINSDSHIKQCAWKLGR